MPRPDCDDMQVDTVIGDSLPTLEQVKALPYTTRVISEAMRLYPQPPVLIRRAIQEDTLAGYTVAPGSDLFISVWNIHRYCLPSSVVGFLTSKQDCAASWLVPCGYAAVVLCSACAFSLPCVHLCAVSRAAAVRVLPKKS